MLGESLNNLCFSECSNYVVSTFVLLLLRGLVSLVLYYTYMYLSWCIINWYKPCVYVRTLDIKLYHEFYSKLKALVYLCLFVFFSLEFNKKRALLSYNYQIKGTNKQTNKYK